MQRRELGFGEAFINTGNLLKPFDTLTALRGCKINFFGGGNNKLFVIYEDQAKVQKIIPLHPAEVDQYDYTMSEGQDTENTEYNRTEKSEDKVDIGRVEQLKSDQNFNLFLNERGEVYVTGQGIYGVLGLGNKRFSMAPTKVFSSKQGVKSIACGSGHCMLLTKDKSLYVWGRNFEGQLGLPYTQISCKPTFNPFFNYTKPRIEQEAQKKLYIEDIFLAGSHSFAVLNDKSLYAWGENLYGQLGLPRQTKYINPTLVPLMFGVKTISPAKTHTFMLSELGELYSTGLNNYGQLGLGSMQKRDTFSHVFEDFHNNPLPEFSSIQTNFNSGLAVTTEGELYVWGKSVLLEEKQEQPVKVEIQKDIASLDHVFLTNLNCLVFAKLMAYEISPKVTPSSGNTKFSIRGYGFTDFNSRQKIRFKFSFPNPSYNKGQEDDELARFHEIEESHFETPMIFNHNKGVFEFTTPFFYSENFLGDADAGVEISLNGETWIETSLSIVIYNCNTRIVELNPRYAHINDKQTLKIQLNHAVELRGPYDQEIKVFFLKKHAIKKRMSRFGDEPDSLPDANKLPVIASVMGSLEDGHIVCELPKFSDLKDNADRSSVYTCYVSATLDGQQLFQACKELVYYSIEDATVSPLCVKFEGGISHEIEAAMIFDSPFVNLQVVYENQTASLKPTFNKEDKVYQFHSPMLTPPVVNQEDAQEGQAVDPPKTIDSIEAHLKMTLCGNFYQTIGKLCYHNPKLDKLLAQLEKDKHEADDDYRARMVKADDPFSIDETLNEKEAEKKRKEIEKKMATLEITLKQGVVKTREFIFIRGHNFVLGQNVQVKLTWSEDLLIVPGTAKSTELIVFEVPDLRSDQTTVVEVIVDVSFNSKQYTSNGLVFDALVIRKDIPDEQKDKEGVEFMKKYKKPKK